MLDGSNLGCPGVRRVQVSGPGSDAMVLHISSALVAGPCFILLRVTPLRLVSAIFGVRTHRMRVNRGRSQCRLLVQRIAPLTSRSARTVREASLALRT